MRFLSKVIEKAATCQVINHLNSSGLDEVYQSAYKKHHSTETALLMVKNNIVQSLDNNRAVLLVLLDMSAAFDTVDHDILLNRLKNSFGLKAAVISWFRTYLSSRTTRVSIKGTLSDDHLLLYSLPQGSIVGPHGFLMYTYPLGDIIRKHNMSFHSYADDTQLFCEFDIKCPGDCDRALSKLSCCISDINHWMIRNRLQLNQSKTELFVIATPRVLNTVSDIQLQLAHGIIKPSTSVKNLGVMFDPSMNMSNYVNSLCKTVNFHIRNLWYNK